MLQQLLKSLNIDPSVLLMNGVLFLVLLVVLNAIFWKPMLRHLEERKKSVSDAYRAIDSTRTELENLRAEYQIRLNAIEADARAQIQATVKDAQAEREALIAQARLSAERSLAEGSSAIRSDSAATLETMRGSLDQVAADTLSKVTGLKTSADQKKLIDEYIAKEVVRS